MSISLSPTPTALRVEIKPSNCFRVALVGVTLAAFAAIFYAQLTLPLRALCSIIALIYFAYCWRTYIRQSGMLQWRSVWFWRGADGCERALRLRHSTVWPGLIVLAFSDMERKRNFALTLFADSFVCGDDARRLRAYLNHFPVFAVDDISD